MMILIAVLNLATAIINLTRTIISASARKEDKKEE